MARISKANIPITQRMVDAINNFAFSRAEQDPIILTSDVVGKSFFAGAEKDGKIGIVGNGTEQLFLNVRRRKEGLIQEGDGFVLRKVDKTTLAIIIGALYGLEELGSIIQLSPIEESELSRLKHDMGLGK